MYLDIWTPKIFVPLEWTFQKFTLSPLKNGRPRDNSSMDAMIPPVGVIVTHGCTYIYEAKCIDWFEPYGSSTCILLPR